jgi:hypothetical protein
MVEMATIRSRGEYQWEAQIRRKGYPAQRKTFETKADAQAWARMIESEIDRGIFVSRVEAEKPERTCRRRSTPVYCQELKNVNASIRCSLTEIPPTVLPRP